MRLGFGELRLMLALGVASGCKCGKEDAQVVGGEAAKVRGIPVAPPPTESALPEQRPENFTVSYKRDTVDEGEASQELLRLAPGSAFQSSMRGGRKVKVVYSPNGPARDEVYRKLREFACESVETEIQRGTPHGGSMLQIQAGSKQYLVNDLEMFNPTAQWSGAYEGCSQALEDAFPDPGESGYVELDIRYEGFKVEDSASIGVDLGPDHRGLAWRDGDMTATVYVGRVRPVDLELGAGKSAQVLTIDLAEHSGVELRLGEDGISMDAIEGAARMKGTVTPGSNKRIAPLGERPKPPARALEAPDPKEGQ